MARIRKLLIANRGEIARRIARTARAMGITVVAVHSEPDADAPFAREADERVSLGGASPAESYLRIDAIVDAARRTGADAIHPGYGFLAENADFAAACEQAGIVFVGPSPEAIAAMGSKLRAKELMRGAGVPVLPDANVGGLEGDELAAAAAEVGYPLLAKPSAGGGGKGMRVVGSPDELEAAVASSRREAAAAFGDDTLLLERYVEHGRHVEIQIFGDQHGDVVHLNERECSVQRRHQKILEESPSVAVDGELRERMGAAAVEAGRALDYRSAGTVEFLLQPDGEFFFLEVNTRLQVEHAVTEMVCGLDLVRMQLQVAQGDRLGSELDELRPEGHAIEVRLYAEDPAADFLPQSGVVTHIRFPDRSGLRVDSGIESGSEISVHYDPMVAKVIAHAPTRGEAAAALAATMRELELDGVRTNRDFVVRLLEDPVFLVGDVDTRFLERPEAEPLRAPLVGDDEGRVYAAAAALAAQAERRAADLPLATISSGWRNVPTQDQTISFAEGDEQTEVAYRFRRGRLESLSVAGEKLPVTRLLSCEPERVELEIDGVGRVFDVRRAGARLHVNGLAGQRDFDEVERFPDPAEAEAPGSLLAPMPGEVIRVDVQVGQVVEAGAIVAVLEAMKMEQELVAPNGGKVVDLHVAVGAQVDTGHLIAVIEEEAA